MNKILTTYRRQPADTITLENRSSENLTVQVINDDGAIIFVAILLPQEVLVYNDDTYLGFYFGNGAVYHTDYPGVNVRARYLSATEHSINPED